MKHMRAHATRGARERKHELADEIVGRLARRHSTAVVLFHHVVAERLGLGPTDHKCLDLVRERGAMAGSDLSAITGLTSGAITGVVARLEQAGYLRREPDPHDGRKQILHLALERAHIQDVIDPLRKDVAALLENFDTHQLTAITEFLTRTTDFIYRHAALLRAETISNLSRTRGTERAPSPTMPSKKPEMKVHR
jgi:DNA-binding MarR family transcriptional regulator